MLAATSQIVDVDRIPTKADSGCITHLVTLRHPLTEDEQFMEVITLTSRFSDVLRQIQWQRAEAGFFGYQIFESLEVDPTF